MTRAGQIAVYNSVIAKMLIFASGLPRCAFRFLLLLTVLGTPSSFAADWAAPVEELARKIVGITGPGVVSVNIMNRSALTQKDRDQISRSLRTQLESLGVKVAKPEQAAGTVEISLSENLESYVWVAEVRQNASDFTVVMVSAPRTDSPVFAREAAPLVIRKVPLWSQALRILDVAVLEQGASLSHIAVLDPEKIAIYRLADGRWQQQQILALSHDRPWPRDLRGRLVVEPDHLLDAYLPGVFCQSSRTAPLSLACHDSDDPWPLSSQFALGGFFTGNRNFFTGVLSPGIGKQISTAKFYSAAPIPRQNYTLWLFVSIDGQVHMLDGLTDLPVRLGWGTDLASVKSSCASGWQVLATSGGDNATDSVQAYEFPDRDPVAVGPAVDFPGGITALWTESAGTTALAVAHNTETGNYEAYRLAVVCGQ
jgi:hypothetical protein